MLTQGISDEDWAGLARLANTTPEEIRTRYEALLDKQLNGRQKVSVTLGEPLMSGESEECISRNISINLGLSAINGTIRFCGTSIINWSATVHLCIDLAGSPIWCTDFILTPFNSKICFHPDLFVLKSSFCVSIEGSKLCLVISGEACYWAFGWHCENFSETLTCFN